MSDNDKNSAAESSDKSSSSNESQGTKSDETIYVGPRMVRENFSIQTNKDEDKDN